MRWSHEGRTVLTTQLVNPPCARRRRRRSWARCTSCTSWLSLPPLAWKQVEKCGGPQLANVWSILIRWVYQQNWTKSWTRRQGKCTNRSKRVREKLLSWVLLAAIRLWMSGAPVVAFGDDIWTVTHFQIKKFTPTQFLKSPSNHASSVIDVKELMKICSFHFLLKFNTVTVMQGRASKAQIVL